MTTHYSRRSVLVTGATAAYGAFAGCTALTASSGSGARLGDVRIQNGDASAHTVSVTIARDGTVLHDETYEIEADTTRTIQATWTSKTAVYEIRAVVDGDSTVSTTLDGDDAREPCVVVYLHAKPENAPAGISIGVASDHPDSNCHGQ